MIFFVYLLMAYCLFGMVHSLMNIKTITLAQQNLNNIMYLIQRGLITDIQYKVYMNEFEEDGYKKHDVMAALARELQEIHDSDNRHNENGLFRP